MGRQQFTFYRSFYESVMKLPKKYRLDLLLAVIEYALDGTESESLTKIQKANFLLIKPVLDAAWKKAKSGMAGGKISKRGPAKKISKGEIENNKEIKIEIESESESKTKDEGFLRFWERYPVKLGREEAVVQWESVCGDMDMELILSGLENWINSENWKREDGRFIPKAEKWLRERWWLQKPKQTVPCGASGHLGEAEIEALQQMLER